MDFKEKLKAIKPTWTSKRYVPLDKKAAKRPLSKKAEHSLKLKRRGLNYIQKFFYGKTRP